jgi:hypothetical protein
VSKVGHSTWHTVSIKSGGGLISPDVQIERRPWHAPVRYEQRRRAWLHKLHVPWRRTSLPHFTSLSIEPVNLITPVSPCQHPPQTQVAHVSDYASSY